jgi:transposase
VETAIFNLLTSKEVQISTLPQVKEEIIKKFGIEFQSLSLNSIRLTLRSLGFTKKKAKIIPVNRNSPRVLEQRRQNVLALTRFWINKKKPIFIDEVGFQSDIVTNYFYRRRGETPVFDGTIRTRNISVICAITDDSILGYQCYKGGVTGQDFAGFLINLLKHNTDIWDDLHNYVFILDKASAHKSEISREFRGCLPIHYLAPYSPFLTPIEELFSQVKREFRKTRCRSLREVLNNIFFSFKALPYRILPKIFHHSLTFYKASLDKIPIT